MAVRKEGVCHSLTPDAGGRRRRAPASAAPQCPRRSRCRSTRSLGCPAQSARRCYCRTLASLARSGDTGRVSGVPQTAGSAGAASRTCMALNPRPRPPPTRRAHTRPVATYASRYATTPWDQTAEATAQRAAARGRSTPRYRARARNTTARTAAAADSRTALHTRMPSDGPQAAGGAATDPVPSAAGSCSGDCACPSHRWVRMRTTKSRVSVRARPTPAHAESSVADVTATSCVCARCSTPAAALCTRERRRRGTCRRTNWAHAPRCPPRRDGAGAVLLSRAPLCASSLRRRPETERRERREGGSPTAVGRPSQRAAVADCAIFSARRAAAMDRRSESRSSDAGDEAAAGWRRALRPPRSPASPSSSDPLG